MSKHRKPPKSGTNISGWNWLCGVARTQGIDLNQTSLGSAAEQLVSRLERCRASGQPLPPEVVRLASRLIRMLGELGNPEASPNALVERIYARERGQLLARQLERGPLIEPKPDIGEPDEPQPPEAFTLFDLIRMFEWAERKARLIHGQSCPEPPCQSH